VVPWASPCAQGGYEMKQSVISILLTLAAFCACSSPAKVEVRPNPLVLEGKDAKGKLEAVIFDENGKELTEGYSVTWMCLDAETVKVQQDGTVSPLSSGKALVDVEIVGTEVHGTGTVEVRIPSWVEVSHEELQLMAGQGRVTVWAEVRNDKSFAMPGYLPTWKADDTTIVSIEQSHDAKKSRAFLNVTPLAPGETYLTASYKELAADIRVVVSPKAESPEGQ
jgi:hypothetical protein